MTTSINDPFLLCSYDVSSRGNRKRGESSRSLLNVYVTHQFASSGADGYVTATVQGDGVHVIDLSTLHPATAHTLGPATTFSCPAATRTRTEEQKRVSTTFAVIETSPDLDPEAGGRTIWRWSEDLSGGLVKESGSPMSAVVSRAVATMYAPQYLPSRLLVLSADGGLTVMDEEDLTSLAISDIPASGSSLIKSFIFPQNVCSFVPARSLVTDGVIVLLVVRVDNEIRLHLIGIGQQDDIIELGSFDLALEDPNIADVSCSTSGCLSVLGYSGLWYSFQIDHSNGTPHISSIGSPSPLRLTGLSLMSPTSPSSPSYTPNISLLSLGSSHVMLAAITASAAPELIFMIWDLRYSVLLASRTLPIPSTLSYSKAGGIMLELAQATAQQALLVVSPNSQTATTAQKKQQLRSSVLVVPFVVPAISTIANAMGRAEEGKPWLAQQSSSPSSNDEGNGFNEPLLQGMRASMEQNRPKEADGAFFQWVKEEKSRAGTCPPTNIHPDNDPEPRLGYVLVKNVLEILLQPSKPAGIPYSPKVMHYLLEREAVTAAMVDFGLLALLQLRNDWKSIQLAFQNVLDLSESDIMRLLHSILAKQHPSSEANAMQVDSATPDVPAFSSVLRLVVCYKTSPATMRRAIREHIQEGEDLATILAVLEGWVSRWTSKNVELLPEGVSKNEHGVTVPVFNSENRKRDLPPFDKVLAFLQTLLDASFLTILQYKPSHRLLRKIYSDLEPELSFIDLVEQLRGPLEPFAKAQTKAVTEASQGGRSKESQGDWRRRRRQAHEQAGLALGLYQVEELIL